MMSDALQFQSPGVKSLMFSDGTPRKSLMTSLVVGTILALINHGDTMVAGGALPLGKIALTYCVPYCVTTWGAVTGKRALLKKQFQARSR